MLFKIIFVNMEYEVLCITSFVYLPIFAISCKFFHISRLCLYMIPSNMTMLEKMGKTSSKLVITFFLLFRTRSVNNNSFLWSVKGKDVQISRMLVIRSSVIHGYFIYGVYKKIQHTTKNSYLLQFINYFYKTL